MLTYRGIPLWRDVRVLQAIGQLVSVVFVVSLLVFFVANLRSAADERGLSLGFDFLGHAQTAIWNSDDNVNTSFTTTVTVKKKIVADEMKIVLEINSRERIPKPIIRHDVKFDKSRQLVLI